MRPREFVAALNKIVLENRVRELTRAQKHLLVLMYAEGPRLVHCVGDLGYRLEVMRALHRKNLAERTDPNHIGLWKGRLTADGRRCARLLMADGTWMTDPGKL